MDNVHQERKEEQHRVDHVIEEIKFKEKDLIEKSSELKEDVVELRKTFFDDVTVNIDNPDEIIETHASIKQQVELLSERERTHNVIHKQLKTLERLKDSPYFGRIDFHEDGENETDKIYIGIASLMDRNDEDFLIYDWRAPISSLYYDYPPGRAEFKTMAGTIKGDMHLKRQFVIRDGQIQGMFDTGLTIGDELLQQALGNQASEQMRNIVATIQKEQNQIIRNEKHKYLIVQGVAGSGKTSAALQRVAYLMYRYRETLNEDNIVLFSPNRLFNSYVSNVLPELGEANMRQTTFFEYLLTKIDTEIDVETPYEQMEYTLTASKDAFYEGKMSAIAYKSSLSFKEDLDTFIQSLEQDGMYFKDIVFRDEILIAKEDIKQQFYDKMRNSTSIPNALTVLSEWLINILDDHKQSMVHQEWVLEEVELLDDEVFLDAYHEMQKREDDEEFYDSMEEEQLLREKVVEKSFEPLYECVDQFEYVDILRTFRQMFIDWSPQQQPSFWEVMKRETVQRLDQKLLSWEDASPYAYFRERLLGENTDRSVRYLFIDEAQDYTPFQLEYIKQLFPHTRMTFLGDVNQAILTHTQEGNPLKADYENTVEKIVLTKSYRSTKQIVEFTQYFSPSGMEIEPFDRDGALPMLIAYESGDQQQQILKAIQHLQDRDHGTIAIICKTFAESQAIYEFLKNKETVTLMTETSRELTKGILVLPIYLAKGIEFDAVIIPNASATYYNSEQDQSILYTACTRAMHELIILSEGEPSPYLTQAPKDKYQTNY